MKQQSFSPPHSPKTKINLQEQQLKGRTGLNRGKMNNLGMQDGDKEGFE